MIDDPNCACDLNIGCSGYLIEIPKLKNDDDDVIDDFSQSTSDVPDLRRTRRPPRPRRTRRPLQPTRPSRQTRPLRRTGRPTQDQDGTDAVDDDEVRIPLVTGDDQDTQEPLNIVSRDPRRTSTKKTSSFNIDDDEDRIPLVTGDDQDTQDPLNIVSRDPRRTSTTTTSSFYIDDNYDNTMLNFITNDIFADTSLFPSPTRMSPRSSGADVSPVKDFEPFSLIERNLTWPLPTPFELPVEYPTPDVQDRPLNFPAQWIKDGEYPPSPVTSPALDATSSALNVDLPIRDQAQVGLNFDIDSTNTHFNMPIGHNHVDGEGEGIHWFEANVELPDCDEKSFLETKIKCRAHLWSLGIAIKNSISFNLLLWKGKLNLTFFF